MLAIDYILDGLEKELELERELGVRVVECDISAIKGKPPETKRPQPPKTSPAVEIKAAPAAATPKASAPEGRLFDFVFIHHAPLSKDGADMLEKIIHAMGKTPDDAPIALDRPFPRAKIYIVLGGFAMRKFFPNIKGIPGNWIRLSTGEETLVTYSPEYILRFRDVTSEIKRIKMEMWSSLKTVMQRVRQ